VRPALSRTAWAALVTAAAVGLPSVAWFVAGSREAAQEATRIEQEPLVEARAEAERIARRLAVRLEALRQSETRRSFLDYEPHIHDLAEPCLCERRLPSPLAQGPADPLIWTHFQIDEVGQLTLPTLADEPADSASRDSARRVLSDERAILEVLECVAATEPAGLPLPPAAQAGEQVRDAATDWVVTVGPFQWHRVSLDQQPALVALRQVALPQAALTQGFAIRREALERLLDDATQPARLRPGPPSGDTEAALPIEGDAWSVALDAAGSRAEAALRASGVRTRFRVNFAAGLVAAALGGVLVVGLVWQSERLARQRARFAAAAAHELRTPLAGLRMYGEMLADESGDPARGRSYARRIAGEAERLGRVVSNLLAFAKLEQGALRLATTAGDLPAAVRDSLEQLRPVVEEGGARIEMSIAAPLPPVRFDRDALHQILQNLVDNAARYSQAARDRTIHVVLDRGPRGPSLSVIDHGPGVDPALRDRLFDAFVRHAAPNVSDGLGLGLALVRALARAQDASVAYADERGGGSRFTVTFPAAA